MLRVRQLTDIKIDSFEQGLFHPTQNATVESDTFLFHNLSFLHINHGKFAAKEQDGSQGRRPGEYRYREEHCLLEIAQLIDMYV